MACVVTYEPSISAKHLAMDLGSCKSAVAIFAGSEILDRMTEKQAISLLLFMYY